MNGLKRLRAESCERLNAKPEQFPFIRNADQLGVHVSLTRLSTHAFLSRSATPANDMPAAIALTSYQANRAGGDFGCNWMSPNRFRSWHEQKHKSYTSGGRVDKKSINLLLGAQVYDSASWLRNCVGEWKGSSKGEVCKPYRFKLQTVSSFGLIYGVRQARKFLGSEGSLKN